MKPKIIQDTREKQALDFEFYGYEVVVAKLDAGDYSVLGMEDDLFIERKASTGELSNNFGKKRAAFFRELNRAKHITNKYIVCEFSYDDILCFPDNSKIPENKRQYVKVNPGFLIKTIRDIEIVYDVEFFFCGSKEKATTKIVELIEECLKRKEQSQN
jgi:hypothetical protein